MIFLQDIRKTFKYYNSPADRLKEILFRRQYHREFHALKGVGFQVGEGESVGIVGRNGAGKSTLLKILTGVLLPDSGAVHVDGRITGLLELGTGFNFEFTGLQNIYLNGSLLGMKRAEIDEKLEEIIAFTELGAFIHESLKTYSSGMVMRLAFSVAIHADPRACVVDEALAVGDAYFQHKCTRRIKEFRKAGGTIVLVSHDMNAVKILCDRVVLLEKGSLIQSGDPEKVINAYNFILAKKSKGEEIRIIESSDQVGSYGNRKAEILDVHLLNETRHETAIFTSGERCVFRILIKANQASDDITAGVLIRDRFGQDMFGVNTHHFQTPIRLDAGETAAVVYVIDELNLGPGKYSLTVALHGGATHVDDCHQWADGVKSFEVTSSGKFYFTGLVRMNAAVRVEAYESV